jgi:hypothetical protein
MPTQICDPAVAQTIATAQAAAQQARIQTVVIDGQPKTVRAPFPPPGDWRAHWISCLLIDRFNTPAKPPNGTWHRRCDVRQGGPFHGIQAQLGDLAQLGAQALWLSSVLQNSKPDWPFNSHGYGQQDVLHVDERVASDGQRATAARALTALIEEAHACGIDVILDIVLHHSAWVFDSVRSQGVFARFADAQVMHGPLGTEPEMPWLNGFGCPRADWQSHLDPPEHLHPDDAVWPSDLPQPLFFRRRGSTRTAEPDARGFIRGDCGDMRQLVLEDDAAQPGQAPLWARYGVMPVLSILIRAHQDLIARYDCAGFRLDTVQDVHPETIETFGNARRECALTLGKRHFCTCGEVYDDEETIARFTGRNGGSGEGCGVDAALDCPLFFTLPGIAKGLSDVGAMRAVFQDRKRQEAERLSSHGECSARARPYLTLAAHRQISTSAQMGASMPGLRGDAGV